MRRELDTVRSDADILSLHRPLTTETRRLIDARALLLLRPSAVVVNTGRRPIVGEQTLVEALRSARIAGAAPDVFEYRPAVTDELLSLENVAVTPHLGSMTRTTREAWGMYVMSAVDALRVLLLEGHGRQPANTSA